MSPFNFCLSAAGNLSSFQLLPATLITDLLQLFFGLPLFLFPWGSHGIISYICMYINLIANSVMLHLCYHFYILILKIKHELHTAPGSDFPHPLKNSGCPRDRRKRSCSVFYCHSFCVWSWEKPWKCIKKNSFYIGWLQNPEPSEYEAGMSHTQPLIAIIWLAVQMDRNLHILTSQLVIKTFISREANIRRKLLSRHELVLSSKSRLVFM